MTRLLSITLALVLVAAVALADTREQPRVAVVLGPQAQNAKLVAALETQGVDLRVPRALADQLGAAHLLAARGYDTVVTVGVDRRLAIAPVAARYPGTRFVETQPDARAIARAAG
jgi:hypothetical protein